MPMLGNTLRRKRIECALALLLGPVPAAGQVVLQKVFGSTDYATVFDVGDTGDVDGDGVPDFVIGLPSEESAGVVTGVVRVISGADAETLLTLTGQELNDTFGWSVDGVGDVDQDGHADFAVGAIENYFQSQEPGYARVVAGSDGHTIYQWVGSHPGQLYGQSVSGIGDFNQDGFDDVLVCEADAIGPGTAFVQSGKTGNGLAAFTSVGKSLGFNCDSAGDVNADGFLDIILGTYNDSFAEVVAGKTGAVLHTFTAEGHFFGQNVAGVGDVNQDGFADVGVSDDFTGAGYVDVCSGLDGSVIARLVGEAPFGHFGSAIAPAGDVDGDGFPDVAVGAYYAETVTVFHVGTGQKLWTAQGAPSSTLGFDLCNLGDLNGDGLSELAAAGLSEHLLGVPGVGAAYVLTTSASTWTDLGHGSTTTSSGPLLSGNGPSPGGAITLTVADAPAFAPLTLVVGSSFAGWPLSHVTLVPTPEVVIVDLQADAAGSWELVSHVPPGIPAGTVFYIQMIVAEPGADLAATNALALTSR
jgi:hypothetical protein